MISPLSAMAEINWNLLSVLKVFPNDSRILFSPQKLIGQWEKVQHCAVILITVTEQVHS